MYFVDQITMAEKVNELSYLYRGWFSLFENFMKAFIIFVFIVITWFTL